MSLQKETERLGYYAKDKDGNLFQYEWGSDETFYINDSEGEFTSSLGHKMKVADHKEYVVHEIGYYIG